MIIDSFRLVAFFHVLLLTYWLGADLGVLLTSSFANRKGISDEARARLREAGLWIDMAPRTCLVLMVPVGLTLAQNYGSPVTGGALIAVWIASLFWLWMVWMIHLKHGQKLSAQLWKIDFAVRVVVMFAFLGFGAYCLATGGPVTSHWLATKFILFGVLVLLGVLIRVILLTHTAPTPAEAPTEYVPTPFFSPLRNIVLGIWALVAVMAFLGVVKPF